MSTSVPLFGVACCAALTRRKSIPSMSVAFVRGSLPTDPIGTTTVTFAGVNAGSEIRIYDKDGTALAGVESCDAGHVLTWPVYATGSAYNTVRVVIVNLAYKIKDFTYTSKVGNISIPVQMDRDPWFSNP